MRGLILVCVISIFWSGFGIARATLSINEIMYDLPDSDDGKEWVEVFNQGKESVDLAEYKLFEGDVNHKLILFQGSSKLEPNTYGVIVSNGDKFKMSFPNFSGNIFDSSFALSNTGELLALKDKDLNIVDQVIYSSSMGGARNGRTISKIDGMWREGKATIGEMNQVYTAPLKVIVKPAVVVEKKVESKVVEKKELEIPVVKENPVVASVVESVPAPILNSKNSSVYLFSLFGLMLLGIGTVYLIRHKKNDTEELEGDDFEIIEE